VETQMPEKQENINKKPFAISQELLFCLFLALGWIIDIIDSGYKELDQAASLIYLILIFSISYWFLKIREKKQLSRWFDIVFFIIAPYAIINSYSPQVNIGDRHHAFYILLLGILNKYWLFEDKFINRENKKQGNSQ
jgi:hypothetical protein